MRPEHNAAPQGNGVAASTALRYTSASSSRADALPSTWAGRRIELVNEGSATVYWYVSQNSGASVDETLAAADDGGANAARGMPILAGHTVEYDLPSWGAIYFVRASASACPVSINVLG